MVFLCGCQVPGDEVSWSAAVLAAGAPHPHGSALQQGGGVSEPSTQRHSEEPAHEVSAECR